MQTQKIYTETTATITDAKANPNKVLEQAQGGSVAILSHNKPRYYMVPTKAFEQMVDTLESYQNQSSKQKSFRASFRPNKARMNAITTQCAETILSASDEELSQFKEW